MVITNEELYRYYAIERDFLNSIYNYSDEFIRNGSIVDERNKYKLHTFKELVNNSFSNVDEICQYLSINYLYLPVDIYTSTLCTKNYSIDKIKKLNIKDLLEKSEFYVNEYARDKDNHIMTPLEEFFVGVNDLLKDLLKKGYDEYERYKN